MSWQASWYSLAYSACGAQTRFTVTHQKFQQELALQQIQAAWGCRHGRGLVRHPRNSTAQTLRQLMEQSSSTPT